MRVGVMQGVGNADKKRVFIADLLFRSSKRQSNNCNKAAAISHKELGKSKARSRKVAANFSPIKKAHALRRNLWRDSGRLNAIMFRRNGVHGIV